MKRKSLFYIIAGCFCLSVLFYGFDSSSEPDWVPQTTDTTLAKADEDKKINQKPTSPSAKPVNVTVMVDIKGEVKTPGVYRVGVGDRIKDVIHKAGGLTSKADARQVNFAKKVVDEMMIYIPKEGETIPEVAKNPSHPGAVQGKINVNQATVSQLEELPGIGPAKANNIINYRKENGPFQNTDDLLNVNGIGEKSLETLMDLITF